MMDLVYWGVTKRAMGMLEGTALPDASLPVQVTW